MLPPMRGLLLVDHGSRRQESNQQLTVVAERLRALKPDCLVAHAHMELAEPSIAVAFAELAQRGASEVRVLLYFLGDGRHSREDIPRLVAEAAARFPQVAWRVAPPLGPHDLLAQLLLMRGGFNP